jgi:hypothetical protein
VYERTSVKNNRSINTLIHTLLNGAALLCAASLLWQFAKQYFPEQPPERLTIREGQNIYIDNYDWPATQRTVLLAVSTTCQQCTESAAFFRELVAASRARPYQVIVASAESAQSTAVYLARLGVTEDVEIRQVSLSQIGIQDVPAVAILDNAGTVESVMLGKLTPHQQKEVFRYLQAHTIPLSESISDDTTSTTAIDVQDLISILQNPSAIVLEIRERSRFYEAHISGALNMPLDEIGERAPHELPLDKMIAVYCVEYICDGCTDPNKKKAIYGCEIARKSLSYNGVTNIGIISGSLGALVEQNVPIEGKPCI